MTLFHLYNCSLDNAHIDERLHKDTYDFVWQQIKESDEIQKNITPLQSQKSHNYYKPSKDSKSQSKKDKKCASKEDVSTIVTSAINNLAEYVIQASGGCILYADRVLNLFRAGKLQVKLASSFSMVGIFKFLA